METLTNSTIDSLETPADNGQFIDKRAQLEIDPKQIEVWELMVLETQVLTDWIMIFSRYLTRGGKLVSPGLPDDPLDELKKADLARIRNSQAFKELKRYKTPELRRVTASIVEQMSAGF